MDTADLSQNALDQSSPQLTLDFAGTPTPDLRQSLYAIGYDDEIVGLRLIARLASYCAPSFHALRSALPNLAGVIDLFGAVINSHPRFPPGTTELAPSKFPGAGKRRNFVEWALTNANSVEFGHLAEQPAYLADLMALSWIEAAATRLYADQIISHPERRAVLADPIDAANRLTERLCGWPDALTGVVRAGMARAGAQAWCEAASWLDPELPRGSSYPVVRADALLGMLRSIRYIPPIWPQLAPASPAPALREKDFLAQHPLNATPAEIKALQKFLKENLDPDDLGPYHFEAVLAGLATFMCLEVQSVLQVSIVPPRSARSESRDCTGNRIEFLEWVNYKDNDIYVPCWLKVEHGLKGAQARLSLPLEIGRAIRRLMPSIATTALARVLPVSELEWSKRTYACLARVMRCSEDRARLVTRDLVPRLIYESSGNAALVRFFRTSAAGLMGRPDQVALSHYLQINDRSLKEFEQAWARLSGKLPPRDSSSLSITLGTSPLSREETKKISEALELNVLSQTGFVERHNAFSALTLFRVIAATGHRPSRSPFPFAWDFAPDVRLVFIADKICVGSEARFAPLTRATTCQIGEYVGHLRKLAKRSNLSSQVRDYAQMTAAYLTGDGLPISQRNLPPPAYGTFFCLTPNGRLSRMTTNQLDSVIYKLTQIKKTVKALRTTLAQSLWDGGCGGRAVQTILGHHPELHAFGSASTWSVLAFADRMRPEIDNYLAHFGIAREQPCSRRSPTTPDFAIAPPLELSGHGYEGRQRDGQWSRKRAREVIKQVLAKELLEDDRLEITDADWTRIRAAVAENLGLDPAARAKVEHELAGQLEALRKAGRAKVSAAQANVRNFSPGPIDVGFSRGLRIASSFWRRWHAAVGRPIADPTFDRLERLAQIAISLVCADATLDMRRVEALTMTLHKNGPLRFPGGIRVRAPIDSGTHEYDWTLIPCDVTAGLILGLGPQDDDGAVGITWKHVHKRAAQIIRKVVGHSVQTDVSLRRLAEIFRPFWLVRLPGFMYAVSVGQFCGPAASASSEHTILGDVAPSAAPMEIRHDVADSSDAPQSKRMATKALSALVSLARGRLEAGTKVKRVQRAKLRELLDRPPDADLALWCSRQQIVDLLHSFLRRLLESGGVRKSTLAFSSIETYFSRVAPALIDLGWDQDLESWKKADYENLYSSVVAGLSNKSLEGATALKLFHSHLRDQIAAPYCGSQWSDARLPFRCRSAVLTHTQLDEALYALRSSRDTQKSALLIALGHGYGLRRREAFGSHARNFDPKNPDFVRVSRNRILDTKSATSRRVLTGNLATALGRRLIARARKAAASSPHAAKLLFEDLSGQQLIVDAEKTYGLATRALRQVTQDPTFVHHHLRHTFATVLLLCAALPSPRLRFVGEAMQNLAGTKDFENHIRDVLPVPPDWPFRVYTCAMTLGHADVSTLLNTYFHGSCFLMAEYTHSADLQFPMQDARLANLLGKERSVVTKLRNRLQDVGPTRNPGWTLVVRELLAKTSRPKHIRKPPEMLPTSSEGITPWVIFQRALVLRKSNSHSLDELYHDLVETFEVPESTAKSLIDGYRAIVAEMGMDDFEPSLNGIGRTTSFTTRSITRCSSRRERIIEQLQRMWTGRQQESLQAFLHHWAARVRPECPRLVFWTPEELEEGRTILKSLAGVGDRTALCAHGDLLSAWTGILSAELGNMPRTPVRASRGWVKAKVSEISLSLQEGADLTDRDFHRAMLMVHVCAAAGL